MDKMKILFICTRNTARSIIAEAIFNSLASKWIAESAGIEKADRVNEKVVDFLMKRGLKAKEKPRSIEEVNLDDYDLIVTVCEESCIFLPTRRRTVSWYIEDPVGKSEEVLEKVYSEMMDKIKSLLKELEG
ncbi:MAG: low molecular weight phosphatase family protein [Archaeoglobaceae archaeon]|nr:low molecular weight phosphatase family protein [Archaeoglobaceae archaeon]